MTKFIAIDTETFPIGPMEVAPKMVCLSWATDFDSAGVIAACEPACEAFLREAFEGDCTIIGQKLAFDLWVICRQFPALLPAVFQAAEDGRLSDTKIREALLNLSTTGSITSEILPDGSLGKLSYSMEALALKYLGVSLAETKGQDSWRVNYQLLDGKPAADYPHEAFEYARNDAVYTLRIWQAQQDRVRSESGYASLSTDPFHTAVDFALYAATAVGLPVDHAQADKLRAKLAIELNDDKLRPLIDAGVLRPAEPARPHSRQMAKARNLLDDSGGFQLDLSEPEARKFLEPLGIKFTAPVASSINTKALASRVETLCKQLGREPARTDGNGISLTEDALAQIADHDPILKLYQHRAGLQKVLTTDLKCLTFDGQPVARIHPGFNVLVETGRTSSSGGKKGFELYPSRNIQNPHEDFRPIIIPDDGYVLVSCDYSSLELVTLAQTCYDLFGFSRLRDLINAGVDLHAYTGARLALRFHEGFRRIAEEMGVAHDPDLLYAEFLKCKKSSDPKVVDFFKHFRKLAKPTNLGYPGGLGPEKFVTYARAGHEVTCTVEEAAEIREVWRESFPEIKMYHEWVNEQAKDPDNSAGYDYEECKHIQPYAYTSKLGMHRAGASFCATANGFGMQTPGAEGGKWAFFKTVRAMCDPTVGSALLDGLPGAFIHDEILGQVIDDPVRGLEQGRALQEIMRAVMQDYCPDVVVRTELTFMRRWYKDPSKHPEALLLWGTN